MLHHMQVTDGWRKPSEVPHPENYKLAGVPRRLLRLREQVARRLAPWAFDPPRYELADHLPHPAPVPPGPRPTNERNA